MKKLLTFVFFIFLFGDSTSLFGQSDNILQALIDQIGGKNVIQNDYNLGKKYVAYFYLKELLPPPHINGGIKLMIDLADVSGVTQEGRDGWVTIWIDATLSVGWQGLPFGFGIQQRSFDTALPDSPTALFDLSTNASVYSMPVELFKITSSGQTSFVDLKLGIASPLSLGEEFSIHGNTFEIKSEFLNNCLRKGLMPGETIANYAIAVKNLITGSSDNSFPANPFLNIRLTTPQDDPNISFIQDVNSDRLVQGTEGRVKVHVKVPSSDYYFMKVWSDILGFSPSWHFSSLKTNFVYLEANQDYFFDFYVTPNSRSEDLEFWLYRKDGTIPLYFWDIDAYKVIEKTLVKFYSDPVGTDINPPTVSFTSPQSGSYVHNLFQVSVIASDLGVGLRNVDIFLNGQYLDRKYSMPFDFSINTDNLSAGNFELTARAYDNNGNGAENNLTLYFPGKPLPVISYSKLLPSSGNSDDTFTFSVTYTDPNSTVTNPLPPTNVSFRIDGNTYLMSKKNAADVNFQTGVEYIYTVSKPTVGLHTYSFIATDNTGKALTPIPDNTFNVVQSAVGWDIVASNVTLSPSTPKPNESFNVNCEVWNNSNSSDKTYYNLPWTLKLQDGNGNILQSNSNTISQIEFGKKITLLSSFNAPSAEGVYQLIFDIYPSLDSKIANNSYTRTITISASGPVMQWLINPSDGWINLSGNTSYTYAGSKWTYKGTNYGSSYIAKFIRNDILSSVYSINLYDFRPFDSNNLIIVYEGDNGNSDGYFSFGASSSSLVSFDQTNGTCLPGGSVTFIATANGTTFNTTSPDIYKNTVVSNWNNDLIYVSNTQEKYVFDIPSNAIPGPYDFYLGSRVGGNNGKFIRQLRITVLPPPPTISSIDKSLISTDDQLTIVGTNFGTSGTVSFGGINSGSIISWSSTTIKCLVPLDISNGAVQIKNSNGISNTVHYNVLSPTGNPEIVFSIPNQTLNPNETLTIADLDDVFKDPNGTALTYEVNTNNSKISFDATAMNTDHILKLTGASDLLNGSNIVITATDASSKHTTANFNVVVPDILNVSESYLSFDSSGGSSSFNVSSNVSWVAVGSQSWVNLTTNGNQVTVSLSENSFSNMKNAIISVLGGGFLREIVVNQNAATPFLTSDIDLISLNSAIGSQSNLTISSNASWVINSDADWLNVSPSNGSGNGKINVTALTINPNATDRSAILSISTAGLTDKMITVTQAGSAPSINVTAGGLSTLLSPTELSSTTKLTLTGTINARDFKTMRDDMPLLAEIDLRGATVVAYSGPDGTTRWGNTDYLADEIPEAGLQGKTILTSLVLPSNITTIRYGAFARCNFTNITIPASVINIGGYSFQDCRGLNSIFIPSSVNSIGEGAFTYFIGSIDVDVDNPNYSSLDGVLYDKVKASILQCPISKTGTFSIPTSVVNVGVAAFRNCEQLTNIEIPTSIKNIDLYSFLGCSGLTNLIIPSSVSLIKDAAFKYCNNLTSITVSWSFPVDLSANPDVFGSVDKSNCILKVPYGTSSLYRSANQWQDFTNIVESSVLTLSTTVVNLAAAAGSSSSVEISSNIPWTAESDQSWLSISPVSGTGNNTLTLTAEANSLPIIRTATVTVSVSGTESKTVTITQAGISLEANVQDDNVLNTIMSGLKIVERIFPGTMTLSVDQNKMLTDNYNSCVKIGDYIVYTKTAQSLDPDDRSLESGTAITGDMLPENLQIKFAWKSDGMVYMGAMGTDDEVLASIVDGTDRSAGYYSGQRTFFEGYALSTELKNMQTASLVAGIPSPDSLNTVDFFRKMSSKIFNRFSKPIFRIFSAVAFQGSPYPVLNPDFALWCPFPGLTTGNATRSFKLSYTNNLNSYVTAVANNDNANSSYIKLDGDIVAQMHKWIENYYRRTAVYPLSVEIGASTIWAHSAPRFSMATVCDNVLYSEVNQNPAGGLSNNRPPMISGIPVYQSDFTPALSVDKANISLGFSIGSTEIFNISSNTNWEASADGDWISISPSKGTGDKAVAIVALTANPVSADRNITITVNAPGTDAKTITVTQKGAVPAVIDVEGNVYPILKIGDQWWMGKDLKTSHYNNGEQIANITVNSDWSTQVAGAYCWYNNDETANKNTFGALYNYYSVADNRNLCPTNWHVPTIDEWTTLTNSLGGASVAGDALKEAGTSHWWDGNAGTNSSGFTAVPGGSRYYDDGVFYWQGGHSRWWSSTNVDSNNAWISQIQHNEGKIDQTSVPDRLGVSVRCVKNVSSLDNGLIAYYPFNGNAIDESGNNHNGTVNNAQLTADRFGNSNRAYRFNGTTDYINLAGTFGGNTELTISAWVYVEQPTSDFYAIVSSSAWGSFCHFQLTGSAGGGIGIYTSPAYFDAPGLNVTPTGRWRHTVLTVKNGETRVYEDNVIQSQSGQTVENFTSTSNLMIGSGFDNGRFFNGKIDDVRIFNRAISVSEVDALYKEGGYSGYGPYLVFNAYQEGHSDVYSCNPDGSDRKQLTSNSVEDYNPKISPDGNKIAFTSDESGQYEVYTMNRDGSGRTKVTSTGTYGGANGAGYVRWFDNDYLLYTLNTSIRKVKRDGSENTEIITSANGNPIHNFDYCKLTGKIVYQAQGGWAYVNNFYLVNIDGTGAQLLVGDRPGLEHYPVFSPDGTKIVYMFDISGHEEGTGRTLNDHLFMHEIIGGAETDLSAEKPDGYNDVESAFASDGSGIIYSSIFNDYSQPSSLFTYNISGSHRSLLISDAFSPDVWPKVDNFTPTQTVSKTNLIVPYTAGTSTTFNINSNTGWQIATDASWITVSSTGGFGDKVITVSSKSTNPGLNDHVGTITVTASGTTTNLVTVTQKGSGLTVIDNEGNIYPIVKIGDQWWMAENLKTTHYNNGDQIPNITGDAEWAAQPGGAYCWYGNDAAANKDTYGALYNWYTVNDSRQIAPKGWHVATDDEWTKLTNYLVSTGVDPCGALKETGFTHWLNPNEGATNSSGFGALPGGYRFDYGGFLDVNIYGHWWSSTASDTDKAWYYYIYYTGVGVARNDLNKKHGFSVRCVKDVSPLDNGLIASYPFNGNAIDQSGNELDLIPNTNPIAAVDRFNNLTGAYSFNGTSDYFLHPTDPLLLPVNELSLCAWFYSTGIDGAQDVLISTLGNSAQNGYQLNLDQSTNTIGVLLRNPDASYVTVSTLLDASYLNSWTSVVFTYSNVNGCKLYLNNVLKAQIATPFQIEYGADQNFRIGTNFPDEGVDRMFKGKIDDVRVYNRALTESEVDALYHEGGWPLVGTDKYLVFNSYQTGNSEIYSCNADGSNRTQLTSNSCQDYNPKISPDGTKIAFTSDESGQYDVYLMNRDGSGRVKVTSTGTYGGANGAGFVRWLDNDRLLYTLGTTIRKVNTDGSANSVIVTSANGNPIHNFDYSNLTGKIVYQAQGGWAYVNDFYLVNLDGSGAELLIGNRAGLEHYPVFNTDGTKIVYTYDLSGHEEVTGRSLDDHLFLHQLTDHSETDLSSEKPDGYVDLESVFTADGSRIVFSSKLNDESQPSSLYAVSAAGVGRSLLISDAFSPDIWPRFGNITPLLSVDKTDISLPPSAGTEATFNVSSNTSWDISSSAPWLNISPVIGFGNKEITVSSKVTNSGTNDQTATITISSSGTASKIITVTQTGTGLTITDFDNNNYSTVQIGNQLWMGENLKTKHYNTGAGIPDVTDNSEWAALTSGGYCWYNNDEASNKNPYGGMYNWHAVNTGNLCPINWHVPTDAEWTILTDYLGAVSAAGDALKEAGTSHWWGGNAGTNSSGFAAVGAGNRYYENGDFYWQGGACRYWSSNADDSANAWALELNYSNSSPIRLPLLLNQGVSVRCLQNSGTPDNTITLSSGQGTNTQSVCNNTAITPITYATTGATGADFAGLPSGVTGSWESNVVTISGTPNSADGSPFNYLVTLTGGSGLVSANGTITVNPVPTISITTPATCSQDLLTWSAEVTVSSGTVSSTAGTVTNTSGNTWSVSGITAGINITLTVTDGNTCVNALSVTAPNCNCPVVNAPVSGGNKHYCSGESLPQINASVENGETVDWYAAQSGGSALLEGNLIFTPDLAGTYFAEARNTTSNCTSTTRTAVVVTMNTLPTQFSLTGGGVYCSGQPGIAVGLSGSQAGVNYQLQLGGVNTGSPVAGTGSAISFGLQSSAGSYTVSGINPTTTCSINMTGNAVVSVNVGCSTHFVTVWTGNGQDHMNINIMEAQTSAVDLEAGDEIGAFDGNLCVGMIKLTQTIHQALPATFGLVKASRADQGVSNGFTPGDAIVFKIWDASRQEEKTANHIVFLNPSNGQVISPVSYSAGASTFVKLSWLNTPPVANAGADQVVSEGDLVSLDGSGSSDVDNDPLTYQWVQTSGAAVTLGNSTTSAPTFTAPSVTQNTDFGFALTVNDGTVNSAVDNVTVTVRPVPKHFIPVWSGNGLDHMNFNVYSLKLDGTDLELGDEIGIYDGSKCVGAGILQGPLSNSSLLALVASADDGSGNGYTPGHSITYRVYDKSADKEVPNVTATYSTSNPAWSSNGKYAVSATAFVGLDARTTEIQQVILNAGWNIFSLRVMPVNTNMSAICQPLVDASKLNKVMDESGKAFEDWGVFGGWQNNIGNLQNTEGYKINVSSTVTLSVEGLPVQLPLDIPLSTGWNIISWPSANEQDGKAVMQSLIDAGMVTKVMDQAGRAIEDWGVFGGWQNNIGNLKPGEGYKVNVAGNCTLTVNQIGTKSTEILTDLIASSYYQPVYSGNGDDHMNINLVDLNQNGFQAGDQIGIFDGKYCVGALTIGPDQLKAGTVSIPASANDGLSRVVNGFTAGHQVEMELYRGTKVFKLDQLILKGNNTFEKNGSLFVSVTAKGLPDINPSIDSDQFKCYPNPFKDEVTIDILNNQNTDLTVGIYNLLGQQIKTLFKGINKGELILKWDGTNDSGQQMSKGVYLCRMNDQYIKLVFNGDN